MSKGCLAFTTLRQKRTATGQIGNVKTPGYVAQPGNFGYRVYSLASPKLRVENDGYNITWKTLRPFTEQNGRKKRAPSPLSSTLDQVTCTFL